MGRYLLQVYSVFKLHEPKDQWGNTPSLERIYTYKTTSENSDTSYKAVSSFSKIYLSLPETLKYIGSDAFSYNRKFSYVYIPQSVEHIGHHAFWDNVTKDKVYKIDCPVCGNNEGFFEDDVLQCMHSCMGAEITAVKCFNCDKAISADTLKDSKYYLPKDSSKLESSLKIGIYKELNKKSLLTAGQLAILMEKENKKLAN